MVVNRHIYKAVKALSDKYPIIALTGPRQSGKSTFLRTLFPNYRYLNFEDPFLRSYFDKDPRGFFKEYDKYCIFDEAQRVPDLFSYLQGIVDNDKIMAQFILSGSQNFLLLKNIKQSLAGRVALFKLFPFDFRELKENNLLNKNFISTMLKGFYPAIFDRNIPASAFYNNYMQTYVERDIAEILSIRDIRTFRNFVQLCAARAGHLLNLSKLAVDCGISQPTAKSWLSLLESSYIIFLVQPLFNNFDKRIIKSPKLFFYDTGLLCHLLKLKTESQVKNHAVKGHIFENMIVAEFIKQNYHNNLMHDFWFWRDTVGHEVDFIYQDDDLFNVVEIKSTTTVMPDLFKGLEYFSNLAGNLVKSKTLIYAGLENQNRTHAKVQTWFEI